MSLVGWQGIVPLKIKTMSKAMVNVVMTQLHNIDQVFRRLDQCVVAEMMARV